MNHLSSRRQGKRMQPFQGAGGTGEYCRGNFRKLFTPQNIGSGIILAELLGPRAAGEEGGADGWTASRLRYAS
jgi:hypothetical protein